MIPASHSSSDSDRSPSASHRSPSRLASADTYRIRVLASLAASLLLVVLLVRLPIYHLPARLGWDAIRGGERITLHEFELQTRDPDRSKADETKDNEAAEIAATAPPTIQTQPSQQESETPAKGMDNQGERREEASDEPAISDSENYVTRLTALDPTGRAPEIIGGPGSFYLQIDYPKAAREQGIQGRVILDFIVDENGQTRNVTVYKSLHPLCDSSAVRALRHTRFVPGRRNGERVSVRMRLPVRFKLLGRKNTVADKASRESNG